MVITDSAPTNKDSSLQLVHTHDQNDIWNLLQQQRPPPLDKSKMHVLHIKEWSWLMKRQYRWSTFARFVSQILIIRLGPLTLIDDAYENWYPSSLQLLLHRNNVKVFAEEPLDTLSTDGLDLFRGLIQFITCGECMHFDLGVSQCMIWDIIVKKVIRDPNISLSYIADTSGITRVGVKSVFDRRAVPGKAIQFEQVTIDTGNVNFGQMMVVMEWSKALSRINLKMVDTPDEEEWKEFILSVAQSRTIKDVVLSGVLLQQKLWVDSLVMLLANPSIQCLSYLFPVKSIGLTQRYEIVATLRDRSKVEILSLDNAPQLAEYFSAMKIITKWNRTKRIMMDLGKQHNAKLIHLKLKTDEHARNNPDILFDLLVEHHAIFKSLRAEKCREELAASEAQAVILQAHIESLKLRFENM